MQAQVLDTMDLERERGITIKLQPVRMHWRDADLNLIDTPGHADFAYEVSRSLAACEGALLVVDATQGIQAQTLANVYLAIEAGLTIIPVVNKIDLPAAAADKVTAEIVQLLGVDASEVLRVSAKQGTGIAELLDAIIARIPAPRGDAEQPLRALIFDSVYDEYRGVILYVRVVDGALPTGGQIKLLRSGRVTQALEVGHFAPFKSADAQLDNGQIGYVVTSLKSVEEARVGDTVTTVSAPAAADQALPGYREVKPYVYAGFFPVSATDYPSMREAIKKLKLNDSALQFAPENSQVLGFGFRLGFLGLLHMEIVQQRLEREFDLALIVTNPSVDYIVDYIDGHEETLQSAADLPDPVQIRAIREPWIRGEIVTPKAYVGACIQLLNSIRGLQKSLKYLDDDVTLIDFEAPLANVLTDFYDTLKSISSGYASFNYEVAEYRAADLVRLDILVNGDRVDSLSIIAHRTEADSLGRSVVEKLREIIPRQLFDISLQAAIGGRILARETVRAMGKNVTAKLYGGDVSRKNKLLDKQKKGKKRMKQIGRVEIPPEAFMVLVKRD